MSSGRKLLIQSNTLWAGILLAMAALFLLAFAVQIGAAPLDNAPKSTPPSRGPAAVPGVSGLLPLFDSPIYQYLPIIYQGSGNLTPTTTPTITPTVTVTPTGCVPARGLVQLTSGSVPYGSAMDEDTGNIFVAMHGSGAQSSGITVLNGATVVGPVSQGSFTISGAWGAAYNPVSKKIYVTDEGAGQLLIVNPASRVVEKALGGLASPRGVAIDRSTGTAYVAAAGSPSGSHQLVRYTLSDVAKNTQGTTLDIGNWPTGVAVDKLGRIWVTTQGELVRVTWTDSGTTTWKRGLEHSFGIAYSAGTDRLYVTTGGGSSLVAFNVSGSGDPVEVGGSPFKTSPEYNLDWPVLNATTGRLYVAGRITAGVDHSRASRLWVFDVGASAFLTPPLDLDSWNDGTMMRGVSLDKQGRVYVSSEYADRVYVLNDCGGSNPTPTPTPPTPCTASQGSVQLASGSAPHGSAVDEQGGNVFVALHGSGAQSSSIVVLNGTTTVGTVSKGSLSIGGAWGVAYNPLNNKMYVTDEGAGQLLIVDPTSRAVEKALGGLANPRGVAIEPGTGTAYVASSGAHQLVRYTLSDVANNTQGSTVDIGNWPTGVVVDKQGRIWVTTQSELVRVIWTDSGTDTQKWGVPDSFGIAYNAATDRLYVTTGGSSSLIVYDISGSGKPPEVAGSPFKTSPEYNLDWPALNAGTGRLYVAGRVTASADHPRASKLWVFNTVANTFGATPFDLDSWNDNGMMRGVSLDKQGRVYVSSEYTDRVYVFSDCSGGPTPPPSPTPGCAPKTAGSVQLATGSLPSGSAASDATGQVFVANRGSATQLSSIVVLSGTTAVGPVSKGSFTVGGAWGVAYNPLSNKIYVTDEGAGQLLIVDPTSRAVEKALGGLASPRGVVIEPGSGTAYVASSGAHQLVRYTLSDVANNTQGSTVDIGNWPTGVALDKMGRCWVTTQQELVRVIWTGTGTDVQKWGVPGSFGIAYSTAADRLYVTTGWNSELLTYDVHGAGNPVLLAPAFKTTPVEYNLDWLALNPNTGRLFVAGRIPNMSSRLFVFDTLTNAWSATSFPLDGAWNDTGMVRGVSFEPKLKRIYVSSEFSDKVFVFNDTGACP